jgi:hypothetical protein
MRLPLAEEAQKRPSASRAKAPRHPRSLAPRILLLMGASLPPRNTSVPGPATESLSKGTIIRSLAAAVQDLWGEDALRGVIERLPPETRAATASAQFIAIDWYPTRHIMKWGVAILDGPAFGDEVAFSKCVSRSVELGFGLVQRAFLAFATPTRLAGRAADLWRHEHSHGTLVIESSDTKRGDARLALRDHPFVTESLARIAISEGIRTVLSLSRARNVRERHAVLGDALFITLRWDV